MAAKNHVSIEVTKKAPGEFHVRVVEGSSESSHRVTLMPEYYRRLTDHHPNGTTVEETELIRRSFEFLLEREPKESILAQFELQVISRYFPEYEREMKRLL